MSKVSSPRAPRCQAQVENDICAVRDEDESPVVHRKGIYLLEGGTRCKGRKYASVNGVSTAMKAEPGIWSRRSRPCPHAPHGYLKNPMMVSTNLGANFGMDNNPHRNGDHMPPPDRFGV